MRLKRYRTYKYGFVAALVVLVLVVRGARRQRSMLRLVVTLGLFNPFDDAVNGVANFFGGIGDDIKNFVRACLNAVYDVLNTVLSWIETALGALAGALDQLAHLVGVLIQDAVNAVLTVVQTLISAAVTALTAFISAVRDLATTLYNDAISFANSVYTLASSFALGLYHDALGVIETVAGGIRDAVTAAISAAVGFLQGLISNVLSWASGAIAAVYGWVRDFVAAAVQGAIGFVRGLISDAIGFLQTAISDVKDGVVSLIEGIAHDLRAGIDELNKVVFGGLTDVVGVVEAVIDWLIWLAKLPFTAAGDIARGFRDATGRNALDGFKDSASRLSPQVLDHQRKSVAG